MEAEDPWFSNCDGIGTFTGGDLQMIVRITGGFDGGVYELESTFGDCKGSDVRDFVNYEGFICWHNFSDPISMASGFNRGGGYYGAEPYRSREGLSTRQGTGSDEIQLRIDPMHADLDDEISVLRKQVKQLKNVASEIESEAKFQNEFINQLQMTLIKAQAGVKNNMRKLNKSIVRINHGSFDHLNSHWCAT
ncbi:hypothetical protein R6Q57_018042 [Mikania cordata]